MIEMTAANRIAVRFVIAVIFAHLLSVLSRTNIACHPQEGKSAIVCGSFGCS